MRGGHLHRQPAGAGRHALHRLLGGACSALRQHARRGVQALQRVADQREGLGQRRQAVQVAAGHGRPGVLGRRPPACAPAPAAPGRSGPAAACRSRRALAGGARLQAWRTAASRGAACPGRRVRRGTEEEQVLRQPVGDPSCPRTHAAQLRQQPRGQALDVTSPRAGRRPAPRRRPPASATAWPAAAAPRRRARRTGRSCAAARAARACASAPAPALPSSLRAASSAARGGTPGSAGSSRHCQSCGQRSAGCTRSAPASCLHGAVLREQRHRRHRLAGELRGRGSPAARRRPARSAPPCGVTSAGRADHALHRHLAGAQHAAGRRQADQLQRAHALVQVVARAAQHRRVGRVDVGAARDSASFSWRRSALWAPPANGAARPAPRPGRCRSSAPRGRGGVMRGALPHSARRVRCGSGDLEARHRLLQFLGRARQLAHHLRVERVPSPVCSVTAKMCWMFSATTLADWASFSASRRCARSARPVRA
jgi:hypothetical protein